MAITRLERKGRKNKARAKARVNTIKRLNSAPVLKMVDVEAIKAEFEKKAAPKKASKSKAEKKEEVKEVEAKVEETPVAEAEAPEKTEE
ncbi:hypothetical protein [Marinoscillum sp. MHG1-6]|uniref:hypothetical protein n=1 Tax=Marinoscillum sp. MHG1-6 TaxID=2959627 RepID=UPI0021583591|nr:hypothetical protein [Marinoscillum sp. MHG1-6]